MAPKRSPAPRPDSTHASSLRQMLSGGTSKATRRVAAAISEARLATRPPGCRAAPERRAQPRRHRATCAGDRPAPDRVPERTRSWRKNRPRPRISLACWNARASVERASGAAHGGANSRDRDSPARHCPQAPSTPRSGDAGRAPSAPARPYSRGAGRPRTPYFDESPQVGLTQIDGPGF